MANPTYQSGFYAPGRGTAKHPELWRGCVGAWNPGLGNTGLVLRDQARGNHGTLTSGPTWGVSGGQQALTFDGVDDYVNTTNTPALQLSTGTMSAWIKTSNAGTAWRAIAAKANAYGLFLLDNVLVIYDWGTSSIRSTGQQMADNNWHHVAVAFVSGSTNGTFIYSDGVLKLTTTMTISEQSYAVQLSGNNAPALSTQYFNGSITDARIYNRALSPNEIRLLAKRPGIAYELAPRKSYFLSASSPPSPTTSVNISANNMLIGTYL